LLQWLDTKTRADGSSSEHESLLDVLLARRPDLADLPLTCENAERVLPYIDLTLEILEARVANEPPEAYNSEESTEELLAAPQYTRESAYGEDGVGGFTQAFRTPF